MHHDSFIHSFVNGHPGGSHVLPIVNSAAMNIGVHVSFSVLVSSGYMPRSRIAESYGDFFLVFKGISIPSSIVAVSIYIPPTVPECSLFSTPSPAFIVCRLFDEGKSDRCEVISNCGFAFL